MPDKNIAMLDLRLIALELADHYNKHNENRLSPEQIQQGDLIAYFCPSKNASLSKNTGYFRLMKVKKVSRSPQPDSRIYFIEADKIAAFDIDPEKGLALPFETVLERVYNRTAIDMDIGFLTMVEESQFNTALRCVEKLNGK